MSKKKRIDEIVHDAIEETMHEVSDQLADKVAARLMELNYAANSENSENSYQQSFSQKPVAHKTSNPGAGP